MPSTLPAGEPAPRDGALPDDVRDRLGRRPLGVYVHVPFCVSRCGYCDFNTYTASELTGDGSGASPPGYVEAALAELRLARRVAGPRDLPVSTVFFGGGTPTVLPAVDLLRLLDAVREEFGLTQDAEVTTEANPESVSLESLDVLRAGGFTRVSFGLQSAVPEVLEALDRTHTPGRAAEAVTWARQAGFDDISLDLIYGAPGETEADWRRSLDFAVGLGPDHVSAYALIVEEGTRLAAQVRRGDVAAPDDDDQADKYLLAEELLADAGFAWYEVSNWAREGKEARHNLGYWRGDDWWGVGPGAHSHLSGLRWWNVKHPAAYAARLATDESPAAARERLTADDRRLERVLLEVRLRDGLPGEALSRARAHEVARLVEEGLVDPAAWADDRVVLTVRGRLLADHVVRRLS